MRYPARWLPWLLCWLALSASTPALAGLPLITLSGKQAQVTNEITAVRVLEDTTQSLQIRSALPLLESQGENVYGRTALGYSRNAFWIGFRLSAPAGTQYYLEVGNPFIDEIELWVYIRGQLALYRSSGDLQAFSNPIRTSCCHCPASAARRPRTSCCAFTAAPT